MFVSGVCVHVCIEGGREEDQGLLGTGHKSKVSSHLQNVVSE